MIEAVFDTNVFLQAALSDTGPAFACWEFVEAGAVRVWITEDEFSELEDVLNRDRLRRRINSAQTDRVSKILELFRKHTSIVATPPSHYRLDRDIDDELYINLAIQMNADFLVSRDRDLLDLTLESVFVSNFPNLRIVNPVTFLEILRTQK